MKNKKITLMKQGKQEKSRRLILLEKREILINKIVKINREYSPLVIKVSHYLAPKVANSYY